LTQLIEKKRRVIAELEGATFPAKVEEAILLCVPFYVAKYKTGEMERLKVFPLVIVSRHDSFAIKLRRAIKPTLGSRIGLLLRPRSEVLERKVFTMLEGRLRKDEALKRELDKVAGSHNLLRSSFFTKMVVDGMRELMEEGWILERERKEILDEYVS